MSTDIDYRGTAGCVSMIKLDMIQELVELIKRMYNIFSKYNQYPKYIMKDLSDMIHTAQESCSPHSKRSSSFSVKI